MEQIRQGSRSADAVGLIDWDEETGISGDLYKPETFERIEQISAQKARGDEGNCLLDVTVRAAVMYKKRLLERAKSVADQTLGVGLIKGRQRDVEVVLLEVVKVNGKLAYRPVVAR